MSVNQQCSVCGTTVTSPDSAAGKVVSCPGCGDLLKVRTDVSAASQPDALPSSGLKNSFFKQEEEPTGIAIKGVQGVLEVFDDHLTIAPKGVLGFLNHGLKGTKTIRYSSITAIQHRRAGAIVSGYLQFTIPGSNESRGGIFDSVSDENSFVFRHTVNEQVEKAMSFISQRISGGSPGERRSSTPSLSEQLEKLASLKEQGILSEEEYSMAKTRLLE